MSLHFDISIVKNWSSCHSHTLKVQDSHSSWLVLEVALDSHFGKNCLYHCDGWYRGPCLWPGACLALQLLGHIMNVIGEPIDKHGPIKGMKLSPIHGDPPPFVDQSTTATLLETWLWTNNLSARTK